MQDSAVLDATGVWDGSPEFWRVLNSDQSNFVPIPAEAYHADRECVSRSQLEDFRKSPALYHGRHVTGIFDRESTKSLEFGDIFHEIVLTPQRVINATCFGNGTVARFSRCDVPSREPEFDSRAGSRYWHTPEGLIRESNHWGYVKDCWWTMAEFGSRQEAAAGCGFCRWDDFFFSDRFQIIPPEVLNAQGHKKGKAWTDWEELNSGVYLFKDKEFVPVPRMLAAIRNDEVANALVFTQPGLNECSIRWTCPRTGLRLRCRLDRLLLDSGRIVDVKTTPEATPFAFGTAIAKHNYHNQVAFYQDGVEALTGERMEFDFVAVEKEPPFGAMACLPNEELVKRGREQNYRALDRLAKCRESGEWNAETHNQLIELPAPGWAFDEKWEME